VVQVFDVRQDKRLKPLGQRFVSLDDAGQSPNGFALKDGVDDEGLLDLGPEAQSLQQQIIRRLVRTVNQNVNELFVHLLIVIGRKRARA
jgi:hypothetical protein